MISLMLPSPVMSSLSTCCRRASGTGKHAVTAASTTRVNNGNVASATSFPSTAMMRRQRRGLPSLSFLPARLGGRRSDAGSVDTRTDEGRRRIRRSAKKSSSGARGGTEPVDDADDEEVVEQDEEQKTIDDALDESASAPTVYTFGGGDDDETVKKTSPSSSDSESKSKPQSSNYKSKSKSKSKSESKSESKSKTNSFQGLSSLLDDEFDDAAIESAAAAVEAALASSADDKERETKQLQQREQAGQRQPEAQPDSGAAVGDTVGDADVVGASSSTTSPAAEETSASSVSDKTAVFKAQLLDSFYGTNRGLSASGETRAEVNELIARLEAVNPTPSPTQAMGALGGTWRLAGACRCRDSACHSSTSDVHELLVLLAADNLPGLSVGDMTQTIDAVTARVENRVAFSMPMVETSMSASASFEVRSPKRLQVKFNEAGIETPTFADASLFSIPATVDIMGQQVDTSGLASALVGSRPVRLAGSLPTTPRTPDCFTTRTGPAPPLPRSNMCARILRRPTHVVKGHARRALTDTTVHPGNGPVVHSANDPCTYMHSAWPYRREPLRSAALGALDTLGEVTKDLPGIRVQLPEDMPTGSQEWLLTTYLDGDVRIARGDSGSVFVLTKVY